MKKILLILFVFLILALIVVVYFYGSEKRAVLEIQNFEECAQNGFPVAESYPRQCRTPDGRMFTEEIILEEGLIRIFSPMSGEKISSPLRISGEARGNWFFEADFPVVLTNWDGLIIAEGIATAQDEWMTTDFVPFTAELEFDDPSFPESPEEHFSRRGSLILMKSNASGLPEHDDALEVPIWF